MDIKKDGKNALPNEMKKTQKKTKKGKTKLRNIKTYKISWKP